MQAIHNSDLNMSHENSFFFFADNCPEHTMPGQNAGRLKHLQELAGCREETVSTVASELACMELSLQITKAKTETGFNKSLNVECKCLNMQAVLLRSLYFLKRTFSHNSCFPGGLIVLRLGKVR